ncbi:hypothetical protein BJ138DRAFT_1157628 [Hygrophoropsis aurantiaca]|uniref:Uncharacterized protein n=1 Tax=Hygrophoropsis aurantiaca TaxID=72124 RepID=A0ACB8A6T1_9AGAM|nr:hypothetical protein BJ138DRAFT_1157628 [Hygrophoropsis aurantiaca]
MTQADEDSRSDEDSDRSYSSIEEEINPTPKSPQELLSAAVMDQYNRRVFNDIPAHLIYIPSMQIIERSELFNILRPDKITHTEIDRIPCPPYLTRSPALWQEERVHDVVEHLTRYAIFSHRWLPAGEPTFQDMSVFSTTKPKPTGPGYEKLTKFCETARAHGCILAWSDTCCINKESSSELDEAIRSMFRWYRNAHICIAYLAESESLRNFKHDAWFTRGWTLQELLAPSRIVFYGKGWRALGDGLARDSKASIVDEDIMYAVSRVTGISEDELCGFEAGTDMIHMKMTWASKRQTTRLEDRAYSLLGIFDVSMTVAYGEGTKAWDRLMELLVKECHEWEVFGGAAAFCETLPPSPDRYLAVTPAAAEIIRRDRYLEPWQRPGDRFFKLTKRGLKARLLVVEVKQLKECPDNCHWKALTYCPMHVTLTSVPCNANSPNNERATFCPVSLEENTADSDDIVYHQYGDYDQWGFGIANYAYLDGDVGEVEAGKSYVFVLLGRKELDGGRKSSWKKIYTGKVFAVRCEQTMQSPLTTVWLENSWNSFSTASR